MKTSRVVAVCVACFVAGALSQAGFAQGKKPGFDPSVFEGSPPAVGAWYLGGDKAKGQQIFDGVTSGKKVEGSDWFRIGRVYAEAGEWEKARGAFDKAIAMNADDDTGTIEYGAYALLNNDRAKAEGLFRIALQKKPKEFWHWVNAGGSYLGVKPQ
jgi:tetratricopeptide (TPR) repeat protein